MSQIRLAKQNKKLSSENFRFKQRGNELNPHSAVAQGTIFHVKTIMNRNVVDCGQTKHLSYHQKSHRKNSPRGNLCKLPLAERLALLRFREIKQFIAHKWNSWFNMNSRVNWRDPILPSKLQLSFYLDADLLCCTMMDKPRFQMPSTQTKQFFLGLP